MVDLETKEVQWLNFLGKDKDSKMQGDYGLCRRFKDTLVVSHSAYNTLPAILSIVFKTTNQPSLSKLIDSSNL